MAISASFSVSQSAITPASVTVTDTSTGSYDTITQRRIFVSTSNGQYLTGNGTVNYTAWPLVNTSITLSILTQDTAANILVQWLDNSGAIVDATDNNYPLSQFGKQFFYYLIQLQGLKPETYQDSNYSGNLAVFWSNIVGGDNAVEDGNDISAAQNCYDREIYMMQHQSQYF